MPTESRPTLTRTSACGITFWTDETLWRRHAVRVCFTERTGGASMPPYASLNLALHVGDEPAAVDENRSHLLAALDLAGFAHRLTLAQQVHGDSVAIVEASLAGAGASSRSTIPAVPGCDALITMLPNVPLLLCFADCVPIVLVAPGPAVGVVHSGWRGTLAGIAANAVRMLADSARCETSDLAAYVGPHIGRAHYHVSAEILSQFVNAFDTVARAESGGLDLGAVVNASLTDAGVDPCNIAHLGRCTAEATDRFFSHRAEGGLTGRHGALACIVGR